MDNQNTKLDGIIYLGQGVLILVLMDNQNTWYTDSFNLRACLNPCSNG